MIYLSGTSKAAPAAVVDGEGDLWFTSGDTLEGPYFSTRTTVPATFAEIETMYGITATHAKGDEIKVRL